MFKPQVSVIMAVWNSQKYLRDSIDSILNQSLSDFELIIIDDASTDSSLEICKSYTDKRIRVLENTQNSGPARSRNQAIQVAQSDLIAILDSDDIAQKDRLKMQVSFLKNHPDIYCIGSNYDTIDEFGNSYATSNYPTSQVWLQWIMLYRNVLAHSSAMFRKPTNRKNIYNESFKYYAIEDYVLWCQLLNEGKFFQLLPDHLIQRRLHANNISNQPIKKISESTFEIIKSNLELLMGETISKSTLEMFLYPYQQKNTFSGKDAIAFLYTALECFSNKYNPSTKDKNLILSEVANDAHQIVSATNQYYSDAAQHIIKAGIKSKNFLLPAKSLFNLYGMKLKREINRAFAKTD